MALMLAKVLRHHGARSCGEQVSMGELDVKVRYRVDENRDLAKRSTKWLPVWQSRGWMMKTSDYS
jgi:hypothetical protein